MNQTVKNKIYQLSDINNININVADMLMTAFSYTDIFDIEQIDEYKGYGIEEKDAILFLLYEFYHLNRDDQDNQNIMDEYFYNNITCLNPSDYLNDAYVKVIKESGKYAKYELKTLTYEPYQLFAYDDIKVTKDYKEYSAIGYFKEKFSYLALCEGNNVWMSLNPNEIETMKPYIAKARGNVLILGLGMGYVPFHLTNKSDVKSITIVEKDQDIINLFNKLILPKFNHIEKIKIVKDDAIYFVKRNQKFDYIFADLWHSPEDGLSLFVDLKMINRNIDCWLETSMYAMLRRCMITLLEEATNGAKEEDYKYAKTFTDKVINRYYQKTKNLTVNNPHQIERLLEDKTLLDLLIK